MIHLTGKISRVKKDEAIAVFSVATQTVVLKKSQVSKDVFSEIADGLRVNVTAEADVVVAEKVEHTVWFVDSFEIDPVQEIKEKT